MKPKSTRSMNWALLLTMFWDWQVQAADRPSGDARPINAGISNTGPKSPGRLKPLHPQEIERLMREGGQLKAGEVEAIETQLKSDRQDEAAWARLLGYYRALAIAAPPSSTEIAASTNALPYAKTYAVAVEAVPFSLLVDPMGMSRFHPLWVQKPCFETVAAKWVQVAKRYPTNALILARAGTFLTGSGDSSQYAAQGMAFLQEARAIEPQNPSRLIELANRYLEDAQPRFDKPEGNPVAARKALGCFQEIWS